MSEKQITIPAFRKKLREAIANYMQSEGCTCCQDDSHKQHEEAIAKLLGVRKYPDGSGYNFQKYRTKWTKKAK